MTGADAVRVEAPGGVLQELLGILVRANEGKFAPEEIEPDANLFDYGYVDSLTGVVFLAEIEERFGVEIDDLDVVERLNTLERLAAHVAEHAGVR